jgi:hypothetical protein
MVIVKAASPYLPVPARPKNRTDKMWARDAMQTSQPFPGPIVLIRRRSRQSECAHLLRLLGRAGETRLANNINFA